MYTNISDYTKYRNPSTIHTLKEAISATCLNISGDPLTLDIRRGHLLKDSLKESRKAKFKPMKPLNVGYTK